MDGGTSRGSFEVAEYKKPEYKVTVAVPGKFVQAGQKINSESTRNISSARLSRTPTLSITSIARVITPGLAMAKSDETRRRAQMSEDEYSQYYGGGDDMVQESEGKLDARGHMNVEFQVPPADENDTSDYSYRLEAQVTDAARRTIDGSRQLRRHARHDHRRCRP